MNADVWCTRSLRQQVSVAVCGAIKCLLFNLKCDLKEGSWNDEVIALAMKCFYPYLFMVICYIFAISDNLQSSFQ